MQILFSTAFRQRSRSRINRIFAEQLFDAKQLIVFRQTIRAAQRTSFNLSAVRRDRDVRNRRIFRFAGTMRKNGGVFIELRELNRIERFGERTDLVHLDEN